MKEESYIVYLKKKFAIKLGEHNSYQRKAFDNALNQTRLQEVIAV